MTVGISNGIPDLNIAGTEVNLSLADNEMRADVAALVGEYANEETEEEEQEGVEAVSLATSGDQDVSLEELCGGACRNTLAAWDQVKAKEGW